MSFLLQKMRRNEFLRGLNQSKGPNPIRQVEDEEQFINCVFERKPPHSTNSKEPPAQGNANHLRVQNEQSLNQEKIVNPPNLIANNLNPSGSHSRYSNTLSTPVKMDIKIIDMSTPIENQFLILCEEQSSKLQQHRQKQMREFRNRLMNSLSHNLKTPLNSIIGLSQIAQLDSEPAEKNEKLQDVYRNGQILLNLIQQFQFQFTENLEQDLQCKFQDFRLDELVEEVVWIFEKQARLKGLKITSSYSAETKSIFNDKEIIQFVFIQLIENAIKYSRIDPGVVHEIRFLVSSVPEGPNNVLQVEILDEGQGMDPEKIEYILKKVEDKIFSGSGLGSNYRNGYGLGLELANQLIKLVGPSAQSFVIRSVPNQGTSIIFFLRVGQDRSPTFSEQQQ